MNKEHLTAWILMSPALLVLGVFGIFPIFYAFFVSLHAWRIRQGEVVVPGTICRHWAIPPTWDLPPWPRR